MKQPYRIPSATLEHSYEVKKSKFITYVGYTPDRAAAMALLASAKKNYPDARHHCWAYLIGDPAQVSSAAFNDDGEPAGTAGKPILNVLSHRGIGDIGVVVVRYFGGIKLGAGGLVRAYSTATQQAVELLTTELLLPTIDLQIDCDYASEPALRRFISAHEGTIDHADFGLQINLQLRLPVSAEAQLREYCAGRAGIHIIDED